MIQMATDHCSDNTMFSKFLTRARDKASAFQSEQKHFQITIDFNLSIFFFCLKFVNMLTQNEPLSRCSHKICSIPFSGSVRFNISYAMYAHIKYHNQEEVTDLLSIFVWVCTSISYKMTPLEN